MAMGYKQVLYQLALVGFLYYLTFDPMEAARSKVKDTNRDDEHSPRRNQGKQRWPKKERSEKPNIILILTDDQDEVLGSVNTMTKTLRLLQGEGVRFNNSFVTTPMCCPSRSTILTGMYPHNHHVYTNNDNCSGIEWQREHEPRTFAKYLSDAGYRTGHFGKYLNEYNGTYVPPGWREWVGLIKNSRFYNYTVNFNGVKEMHDDNYYQDYLTDLIANDSVTFLKQSKQHFPTKPVMMMLSVPAPHGPEDSAPQYQHMFENNTLHRTPSWNYMNNSDKQWLLRQMKPLEPIAVKFVDTLARKRLQTLQSVDDMVAKVYYELQLLGELDNTYIIYTSDHGYHLGQYGIVKGKALPYDFDTRVPLIMRGPGIVKGSIVNNLIVNADLAPTILDMAGVDIPDHMDGRSMLKLLKSAKHPQNVNDQGFVMSKKPWRDTILIERGKVTEKYRKQKFREDRKNFLDNLDEQGKKDLLQFATPKLRKMLILCSQPENLPPCKPDQKWVCAEEGGKKKLVKCRNYNKTVTAESGSSGLTVSPLARNKRRACNCKRPAAGDFLGTRDDERQRQQNFLMTHVKQDYEQEQLYRRGKRAALRTLYNSGRSASGIDLQRQMIEQQLLLNRQRCRFLQNETLICDQDVTKNRKQWKDHKLQLDDMIEETRKRLSNLKKIRRHMKKKRPSESYESFDEENQTDFLPGNLPDEACNCDEDGAGVADSQEYDDDGDFVASNIPKQKGGKRRWKGILRKRLCNSDAMKCSTHDNEHWRTPPYWKGKKHVSCKVKNMECTEMVNSHWKTPPRWTTSLEEEQTAVVMKATVAMTPKQMHQYCTRTDIDCKMMFNGHWKTSPKWTYGPFCFCTNSNNNTYWCLRTINQTHNFLYCEFISNFINYYDFNKDPYQLRNAIHDLNYGLIQQLHEDLVKMRACQGARACTVRAGMSDNSERRSRKRRKIKDHTRHRHDVTHIGRPTDYLRN